MPVRPPACGASPASRAPLALLISLFPQIYEANYEDEVGSSRKFTKCKVRSLLFTSN